MENNQSISKFIKKSISGSHTLSILSVFELLSIPWLTYSLLMECYRLLFMRAYCLALCLCFSLSREVSFWLFESLLNLLVFLLDGIGSFLLTSICSSRIWVLVVGRSSSEDFSGIWLFLASLHYLSFRPQFNVSFKAFLGGITFTWHQVFSFDCVSSECW